MREIDLNNYVITDDTYALLTKVIGNKNYTIIVDKMGTYEYPKTITRLIRQSCRLSGLALERLRAQSRRYFNEGVHKLPLILAYEGNLPIVFFPLFSPRSTNNIWLNTNAIKNIPTTAKDVHVVLPNDETLILPAQYTAFCGQYVRACFYQKYLTERALEKSRAIAEAKAMKEKETTIHLL